MDKLLPLLIAKIAMKVSSIALIFSIIPNLMLSVCIFANICMDLRKTFLLHWAANLRNLQTFKNLIYSFYLKFC